MRILVTGAGGMLGSAVARQLGAEHELILLSREALDVTDEGAVRACWAQTRPEGVIHLAAMTNVDACQRQPEQARLVNTIATGWLAALAGEAGVPFLLVSSIAVFSGEAKWPYRETDVPGPINVYGETKLAAERLVRRYERHYIVRSGWLFGGGEQDKKFVPLILRLAREREEIPVVADCVGSPTYVEDLAVGLGRFMVGEMPFGTYHLVNEGERVTRLGLAEAIKAEVGFEARLRPVSSDYFPQLAQRPAMEAACSDYVGGWLRPWRAALADYLGAL
ncbi:MAG TPA: NAD(P)-dependent oxidoreductase [Anaerolineae bacterium]|nr:NAD(P)-dependent oxidoreductase [Anaerolineae bacterium]